MVHGRWRVLVCSSVLLIGAQALAAQDRSERDWSLALLGGINAANLSAQTANARFETRVRQSSSIGVQLGWRFGDRWSASVGFLGAVRGARSTTSDTSRAQPEVDIRTVYRDVPLLMHFVLAESPALRVEAMAGPVFSWSVSGDVFLEQTGQQVGVLLLDGRETSALVGVGATFALRVPVFARLQYQAGLTDATVDQSLNSRVLSAIVGVELLRW